MGEGDYVLNSQNPLYASSNEEPSIGLNRDALVFKSEELASQTKEISPNWGQYYDHSPKEIKYIDRRMGQIMSDKELEEITYGIKNPDEVYLVPKDPPGRYRPFDWFRSSESIRSDIVRKYLKSNDAITRYENTIKKNYGVGEAIPIMKTFDQVMAEENYYETYGVPEEVINPTGSAKVMDDFIHELHMKEENSKKALYQSQSPFRYARELDPNLNPGAPRTDERLVRRAP